MNIRADLKGISVIALVAAATMAVVARVPAIRDVVSPVAVRPVVARRREDLSVKRRRTGRRTWIHPGTGREYRSHPFLGVMEPVDGGWGIREMGIRTG